jgi:hypothetical protein
MAPHNLMTEEKQNHCHTILLQTYTRPINTFRFANFSKCLDQKFHLKMPLPTREEQ